MNNLQKRAQGSKPSTTTAYRSPSAQRNSTEYADGITVGISEDYSPIFGTTFLESCQDRFFEFRVNGVAGQAAPQNTQAFRSQGCTSLP